MRYRLYQPADFDNLYAIEKICFQPPLRFTRRYMRELTASSNVAVWIAEEEKGIGSETADDEFSESLTGFAVVEWTQQIGGILAYVVTLEVLPAWRGHGIGRELIRRLEGSANAERAIAIWLHVDIENASAIRLYERSGYQHNGRAEHFYGRNRPAAIFIKHLA